MILLQKPQLSRFSQCTYLPDRECRFKYFFAIDLDKRELDDLLSRGWRKFGEYFFRPDCGECRRCVPLRVIVPEFSPSKGQRRIVRNCAGIEVRFADPDYREEIFDIYRDHSMHRFGKESDENDFIAAFYTRSCPSLQSEYYLNGELIAVGFIDVSSEGMSSVYFVYKTAYEEYRLGTLSVIREIEYAASQGFKYYYLGYYIEESGRMEYKGHFHPNEKFDWISRRWIKEETMSIEQ
jgi:leucyl-tRNA---protein transferase